MDVSFSDAAVPPIEQEGSRWYCAHILMLTRFEDGNQDSYTVCEDVVLFEGMSPAEVFRKAQAHGLFAEECSRTSQMTSDGRPCFDEFAGVRKVVLCNGFGEERPGDGTEVTYQLLELEGEEQLGRLARDEPVTVGFDEYDPG